VRCGLALQLVAQRLDDLLDARGCDGLDYDADDHLGRVAAQVNSEPASSAWRRQSITLGLDLDQRLLICAIGDFTVWPSAFAVCTCMARS
jgi:hypothetical protein